MDLPKSRLFKNLFHPSILLLLALIGCAYLGLTHSNLETQHLTMLVLISIAILIILSVIVNALFLKQLNKINKQLSSAINLEALHSATIYGAIRHYRQVSRKVEEHLQKSHMQHTLLRTGISDERERLRQQMAQRKKSLDYLTKFQKLLSKNFSELLLIPADQVEAELTETLGRVARFMSIERVSLFQYDQENKQFVYSNEWLEEDFPSSHLLLSKVTPAEYPWWFEQLSKGPIVIESLEELPEAAFPEKATLANHRVKSLIAMPLQHNGGVIGYITYDSLTHKRQWEEDEITLLSIANALIVGTLVNQQRYKEIQNARETLEIANKQLKAITRTDSLTGLANRRYFDEMRQIEFSRANRSNQPLCLMLCDLDYFKRLNDSLGHSAGDEAIKAFAQALEQVFGRKSDLCARVGGEEFAVLLPETPLPQAINLAEVLRNSLWEKAVPHPASPIADRLTISIGIATFQQGNYERFDALYSAADKALYEAKSLGRNRVIANH
ncbi:sensor domain-containing diguanylate cyclase [Leeia sp. TBRC 13508]|uniref:diguanylate cyclase n=1 Tax=Leeia speluncae TaxID=2884804 RepID=A0ABS8D3J8_9NEIS|nr:sensor domain-containing diguanylate cyclase [Leeia speluncae]MCB6182754.1 sensor domain-containing diguanylate cyclase [Leeia speluncae]